MCERLYVHRLYPVIPARFHEGPSPCRPVITQFFAEIDLLGRAQRLSVAATVRRSIRPELPPACYPLLVGGFCPRQVHA